MSEQGKSELTVEEAKRQIIAIASETENLIRVRDAGTLSSVQVGRKTFTSIEAGIAKDAVEELVDAGGAEQVPFNGENVTAYRISRSLLEKYRATKGTSE